MSIQDMTTKPTLPKRPADPQLDKDSNLVSKLLAATPLYLYHGSVVPPGFFSGMLRQLSSSLAANEQKNSYGLTAEHSGNPVPHCPRIPFSHYGYASPPVNPSPVQSTASRKFDIRSLVQTESDSTEQSRKRHAEPTVSPVPKRVKTEIPSSFPVQYPMQNLFDAVRSQSNLSDAQLRFIQQQLHLSSLYQNTLLAQQNLASQMDPAMTLMQQHSDAWRRHTPTGSSNVAPTKDPLDLTGHLQKEQDDQKVEQNERQEEIIETKQHEDNER
ncbi:uncharacterized protein LOC136030932 [Artemia franciscana]|uniref:Uncharacterized protein n=2 Tax=Artemia franciscana TaxID=6661 RepID=A0AA88HF72_ARTSF|nr:hypothetical protein QYM36_016654 [Artemia franciscana]